VDVHYGMTRVSEIGLHYGVIVFGARMVGVTSWRGLAF